MRTGIQIRLISVPPSGSLVATWCYWFQVALGNRDREEAEKLLGWQVRSLVSTIHHAKSLRSPPGSPLAGDSSGGPLKKYAPAPTNSVLAGITKGNVADQRVDLSRAVTPIGLVSQVLFLWVDADEHRVSLGIDGDPGIPS
jgi:hypothetical protein